MYLLLNDLFSFFMYPLSFVHLQVRIVKVEKRINEIVNRLNKTKVERKPDLKGTTLISSIRCLFCSYL